jgi:drug/metabolite transporter (DMT)-like permease
MAHTLPTPEPNSARLKALPWIVLTILPLVGGAGVFLFAQVAAKSFSPLVVTWLRMAIALPFLGAWALGHRHLFALSRRTWVGLVGLGLVGAVFYNLSLVAGLQLAPVTDGGLLTPIEAPTQVALSWLILREKPTRRERYGLLLSSAGLFLIVGVAVVGHFSMARLAGDALLVASTVAWPLYTVLGRRTALEGVPPLVAITIVVMTGFVTLAPFSIPSLLARGLAAPESAWLGVLYLGLMGSVLNWSLAYWAVSRVGAHRSAPFANLVPVWTLLVDSPLTGEWPSPWQVLGTAVVVGGIWWGRTTRRRPRGDLGP